LSDGYATNAIDIPSNWYCFPTAIAISETNMYFDGENDDKPMDLEVPYFRTNPHQCFSEVPICVGFADVANLALMLLSLYLRTQKCVLENLQRHGHWQQNWTTKHPPFMLVTRERCECLQWLFWQVGGQGWRPWKRGQVSAER
jgi:hypothetical protein